MIQPSRNRGRGAERRDGGLALAKSLCAGLGLALLLQAAPGCCLVRPPDAITLVNAGNNGLRTPEAAFETFRAGFAAELLELEFKCLSSRFKREQQVSLATYLVARRKLLESKPYLALLAKARIVSSSALEGSRRHLLVVEAAGKRFQIELVREDRFQIYSGTVFLADGPVDFDSTLRVRDAGDRKVVEATVSVPVEDLEGVDLSKLTSFQVEQVWKIDRFGDGPGL